MWTFNRWSLISLFHHEILILRNIQDCLQIVIIITTINFVISEDSLMSKCIIRVVCTINYNNTMALKYDGGEKIIIFSVTKIRFKYLKLTTNFCSISENLT